MSEINATSEPKCSMFSGISNETHGLICITAISCAFSSALVQHPILDLETELNSVRERYISFVLIHEIQVFNQCASLLSVALL